MVHQKNKKKESLPSGESTAPLMRHDPSDLGSLILIWIMPKKHTLKLLHQKIRTYKDHILLWTSLGHALGNRSNFRATILGLKEKHAWLATRHLFSLIFPYYL